MIDVNYAVISKLVLTRSASEYTIRRPIVVGVYSCCQKFVSFFWEVRNVLCTRYFCVWLCWTNEWTLNNLNPWKSKNQENITCDNKNNEWWHLNCFWIFICFQETFLSFIFILTAALFEFFIDISFTFF